jgi:hypothetical protein
MVELDHCRVHGLPHCLKCQKTVDAELMVVLVVRIVQNDLIRMEVCRSRYGETPQNPTTVVRPLWSPIHPAASTTIAPSATSTHAATTFLALILLTDSPRSRAPRRRHEFRCAHERREGPPSLGSRN